MPAAKRWSLVLALAAALMLPSLASAYIAYRYGMFPLRWEENSFSFRVNTDGMPSGSDQAIQEAMNTWSNAGANVTLVNGGTSPSHAYGESDSVNLIDFGALDSDNTIAETTWWYRVPTGFVRDTDIRLNQNLPWGVNGDSGVYDVQNFVTHEMGHTLVLGDLYGRGDTDKTMYGYGDKGETKKRTLDDDDKSGVRMLYP